LLLVLEAGKAKIELAFVVSCLVASSHGGRAERKGGMEPNVVSIVLLMRMECSWFKHLPLGPTS
jgi:hypothetical protein